MQHFIYHLSPTGQAGIVLAKGALTSKSSGEGEIRKALIEAGLIDCIVNLPAKLFLNTQIPAGLWFLRRKKFPSLGGVAEGQGGFRDRSNEILFIDARNLGFLINRRTRELSPEDISKITDTYHNWRNKFPSTGGVSEGRGGYEDIPGFCASAPISKVRELDYVVTPGRYVGLPDDEDDFDFNERFAALKAELEAQIKEETQLNEIIFANLLKIKINE
jgi:type I restriction enzyme M protein